MASPRYDVLVLDLDGTLLDSRGALSPANRDAVAAARAAGMEVIIATGRALVEFGHVLDALPHDGHAITAGGSLFTHVGRGQTIDRMLLPSDIVRMAHEILDDAGHKTLILKDASTCGCDYVVVGNGELDPASQWWFDHLPVRVKHIETFDDDPHPEDTVRIGAVASRSKLAEVARAMQTALADRAMLQHWSAVTSTQAIGSTTHLLEVFSPGVNKWTMIERHCKREGVDPQRIAAIGDEINDIEMVKSAGLGIAMANANDQVKHVADRQTAGHDEDGVARAVEEILTGRW